MGLLSETRREHILEKLRADGKIKVNQIACQLGVTEVTIRRDLARMQREGILRKTYGGAVVAEPPDVDITARYQRTRRIAAKRAIGRLASSLIREGDIIFLEAGSTCYEIIPFLAGFERLTVIVNSLYLMSRLHEQVRHRIILTGGQYRPERMDMVGPGAESAIGQLGGFKAFTGADDISIDAGISGADVVTVGFAKMVVKKASEVIFVGDHTKFDNPALYKIADIDQLNCIITDVRPSDMWLETGKKKNIKILFPS